jgi:hypothetical protein
MGRAEGPTAPGPRSRPHTRLGGDTTPVPGAGSRGKIRSECGPLRHWRHLSGSHPSHEPSQDRQRLPLAGAEARKRCEHELRLGERQHRRLDLEPAVPSDRGPLDTAGADLGEEGDVVERFRERDRAHLAERHLRAHEVLVLDRPAVLNVDVALRGHEHMFSRGHWEAGRYSPPRLMPMGSLRATIRPLVHMLMAANPEDSVDSVALPVVWIGADDVPVQAANQIVAQIAGPNEIILTFGHVTPPIVLGDDEQRREQLKRTPFVPIRPLVRMSLTRARLAEFVSVLQNHLNQYDAALGGGEKPDERS